MKKKALALALSIVMLVSVCVPGTWATDGTEQQLICQKEEHTHTVECYTTSEEPVCGIEAGAGSHAHSETCYNEQGELTCGLEENPGHVHSDECFQTLTCGLEEHTHVEGCYEEVVPEESSDPETSEPEAPSVPETSEPIGPSVPETSEPADPSEPSETTEETESEEEFDVEAAYNYVMSLTSDEEIEAYLATLTEEQLDALMAYMEQVMAEVPPMDTLDCVNFTNPAPIKTSLPKMRRARAVTSFSGTDNPGVETSKTVMVNDDGTYTLRLESYVTGSTTTSVAQKPTDTVLVLDTSGSMDDYINVADKGSVANLNPAYASYYKWNGGLVWHDMRYKNGEWQYKDIFGIWKACGDSLFGDAAGIRKINALKIAANDFIASTAAKDGDNRIAIVTYSSDATTQNGLTSASSGKDELTSTINGLAANGQTAADYGMNQAKNIIAGIPANRESNKVVIMFTDGEPNHGRGFDTAVANRTIQYSKEMKALGTTVYTIGVLEGADPSNTTSDINKYLHYVSSNFPDASSMTSGGSPDRNTLPGGGSKSYYLTADNLQALQDIFQKISEETGGAAAKLDSSTVVKDVISDYFTLPDGANTAITVKTADCIGFENGEPRWGDDHETSLNVTIQDKTVSVSGFDFSEHYVGMDKNSNGNEVLHSGAQKLIIEIPIEPRDGFLGGNNVPTNGAESGIYGSDGTVVENYEIPHANVPIADPVFTTTDKTIYQGKSTVVSGLYTMPDFTGDNAWKAAFVTISHVADSVTDDAVAPSDCTNYQIRVTYEPREEAAPSSVGDPATNKSAEETAAVHVLIPTVTAKVNDVQRYYGESYQLGVDVNATYGATWADSQSHTDIPEAEGTAPILDRLLSLSYEAEGFSDETANPVPKTDFNVTVNVMLGDKKLTNAIITTQCAYGCGTHTNGYYTVHVNTCTLTIKKNVVDSSEPYVFDVLKDGVKYSEVTVMGNGSVDIVELPVGTYSIVENAGWSWRYSATYGDSASLTAQKPTGTVTCTNTKTNNYWLNGFSSVVTNIFGVNH